MPSITDDFVLRERRAKETRALVQMLTDQPEVRDIVLRIAEDYDKLAEQARARVATYRDVA
jgi:hypothetical protein